MADKFQNITELYESTAKAVTATPSSWRAFLISACCNYRLPFDEQLLIYAQRPDATAVLELDRWNQRFGRWVNRGARGIAVFDRERPHRLRYYHPVGLGRCSGGPELSVPRPQPAVPGIPHPGRRSCHHLCQRNSGLDHRGLSRAVF